jgi:Ca2+-binding EF-hand superfamily protein
MSYAVDIVEPGMPFERSFTSLTQTEYTAESAVRVDRRTAGKIRIYAVATKVGLATSTVSHFDIVVNKLLPPRIKRDGGRVVIASGESSTINGLELLHAVGTEVRMPPMVVYQSPPALDFEQANAVVVCAQAVAPGHEHSDVARAIITVQETPAPSIAFVDGTLTMSAGHDSPSDTVLAYTTNGSEPSVSLSRGQPSPIEINLREDAGDITVKVVALAPLCVRSTVATMVITQSAAPHFEVRRHQEGAVWHLDEHLDHNPGHRQAAKDLGRLFMKASKAGQHRDNLAQTLQGDEIFAVLQPLGLMKHFKSNGQAVNIQELLDHLDNNDDGDITLDEFIDGLLHPTRHAGPTSEPGVVLTTVKITGKVPGTKFHYTLDGSTPTTRSPIFTDAVKYYTSVDPRESEDVTMEVPAPFEIKPEDRKVAAELQAIFEQADVSDGVGTFSTAKPDNQLDPTELKHRVSAKKLTSVLQKANRLDRVAVTSDGKVDVDKLMERLDLDHDGRISLHEFVGVLLYDITSVHVVKQRKGPSMRATGGLMLRAIAVEPGHHASPVAAQAVRFPTVATPEVFVMPDGSGAYKLKLVCATPNADIRFSEGHEMPTAQSLQYIGKPMEQKMPKLKMGLCLVVRARAFVELEGDVIGSAVGQIRVDMSSVAHAQVRRTSAHTFSLVSTTHWIGMNSKGAITKHALETDHAPLQDEEHVRGRYKTITRGMEIPQTQLWLRRQTNFRNDDGWESSPKNPVHRSRQKSARKKSTKIVAKEPRGGDVQAQVWPSAFYGPQATAGNPSFDEHDIELGTFAYSEDGRTKRSVLLSDPPVRDERL